MLVAVGLFIRLAVLESPAFKEIKDAGTAVDKPIVELVKEHKRDVLIAMGMRDRRERPLLHLHRVRARLRRGDAEAAKNTMLTGVIIAAAIGLFTIPFYGALSDRVGRRPVYMAGALFSLAFAFPFFALLDTKEPVLIWLAIVLGVNVGHDLMYGPQAAYFSELFETRVRYTGASVGYQLASVFAGGFAPLIAVALLAAGGDEPYLVALYMMGDGADHGRRDVLRPRDLPSDIGESQPRRRRAASCASRPPTGRPGVR